MSSAKSSRPIARPTWRRSLSAASTQTEVDELQLFIVDKVLDLAMYKLLQLQPHLLSSGDRANYYATVKTSIDNWLKLISGDSKDRQTIGVAKPRADGPITSGAQAWAESETPRGKLEGFT